MLLLLPPLLSPLFFLPLLFCHCLVAHLVCLHPCVEQISSIYPLAIIHVLGNVLTNVSLGKVAVSFTHTVKVRGRAQARGWDQCHLATTGDGGSGVLANASWQVFKQQQLQEVFAC